MTPTTLWAIATLLLFIAEIATVNLVTIWFAIASAVSFFLAIYGLSIYTQLVSFILVSVILLAMSYPFIKDRFNRSYSKTNYDRVIGEEGLVIEEINEIEGTGTVKVMGQTWSAKSANKKSIDKDQIVNILEIKGVNLIVKK